MKCQVEYLSARKKIRCFYTFFFMTVRCLKFSEAFHYSQPWARILIRYFFLPYNKVALLLQKAFNFKSYNRIIISMPLWAWIGLKITSETVTRHFSWKIIDGIFMNLINWFLSRSVKNISFFMDIYFGWCSCQIDIGKLLHLIL